MNDFKDFMGGGFLFLVLIALMPVAITGGFYASKFIYCDTMKLCEVRK